VHTPQQQQQQHQYQQYNVDTPSIYTTNIQPPMPSDISYEMQELVNAWYWAGYAMGKVSASTSLTPKK